MRSAHPAPMAGVSEPPFRQICRRMGADVVLSEFLSSEAIAANPEHARGRGVRGGRAADRDPDLRGRRHAWRRRPGSSRSITSPSSSTSTSAAPQEGGAAERRVRLPAGPGSGRPDHPGRHRSDAPSGHGQDPERLERRAAGSGRHRAADGGRGGPRLHPPRANPDADVLGQGQLGRDRPRGGGPGHTGDRQRRRPDRRRHRAHARPHGLRGIMVGRGASANRAVPRWPRAPRGPPAQGAPAPAERSGAPSTPGWHSGSRATPARRGGVRKHLGWYTKASTAPAICASGSPDRVDRRGGGDLLEYSSRSPRWRESRAARGPARRRCAGRLAPAAALDRLRHLPYEILRSLASTTIARSGRAAEVVFCEGKTLGRWSPSANGGRATGAFLGNRASTAMADALRAASGRPVERRGEDRLSAGSRCEGALGGPILIVSGDQRPPGRRGGRGRRRGFGNRVERLMDVGVAGFTSALGGRRAGEGQGRDRGRGDGGRSAQRSRRAGGGAGDRRATSVGYGASFGGLAALLGMLNSCAAGVTVVNIDNGFGAAAAASRICRA